MALKASVKTLKFLKGISPARPAVSRAEFEGEEPQCVLNIAAEDQWGIPTVVTRLSMSFEEAEGLANRILAIVEKK